MDIKYEGNWNNMRRAFRDSAFQKLVEERIRGIQIPGNTELFVTLRPFNTDCLTLVCFRKPEPGGSIPGAPEHGDFRLELRAYEVYHQKEDANSGPPKEALTTIDRFAAQIARALGAK